MLSLNVQRRNYETVLKWIKKGLRHAMLSYFCHSSRPILRMSAIPTSQYFEGAFPCSTICAAATAALPMTDASWPVRVSGG